MLPRGKINSCEGKKAYAKMVQCLNEFEQEMPGLDPLDFVEDTQTHDRQREIILLEATAKALKASGVFQQAPRSGK